MRPHAWRAASRIRAASLCCCRGRSIRWKLATTRRCRLSVRARARLPDWPYKRDRSDRRRPAVARGEASDRSCHLQRPAAEAAKAASTMSRRRQLSDEEQALWSGFARSIAPLRARRKSEQIGRRRATNLRHRPLKREPVPNCKRFAAAAKTPPLAPLGRRLKQRVARGREPIDARIDLHGMTQSESARRALFSFLQRSQADGARMVFVVTGKGAERGERDEGPYAACSNDKCRTGFLCRNFARSSSDLRMPISATAGRARFTCACGGTTRNQERVNG